MVPGRQRHDFTLVECPECDTVQRRRLAAAMALSDLAGDLVGCTFDNFKAVIPQTRFMLDVARAFVTNPQGWLLYSGPNGTGKTHLAAAIANAMRAQNKVCLFLTSVRLLSYIREAFDPQREKDNDWLSYSQRVEAIQKAPVLVVDDLGAEKPSAWVSEQLFVLFNDRMVNRRPTVITTNLRGGDLEPRLASRLRNVAVVTIVDCTGVRDYRMGGR